ncbi:MAG TPA: PIN domain-containing protein [Gemmatimonadaceae bacterium]|nr:PIN domain-containing protein [Gemmatimonadaceae bacterium]
MVRPVAHRFLLDTDTVSDLVRNPGGQVARLLARHGEDMVCTSVVVAAEPRFGARKRGSPRLERQLEAVLRVLDVLPLESPADDPYAELRLALAQAGTPIGPNDVRLAAHALALDLTLVSGHGRGLTRAPAPRVANWMAPSPS